MADVRKDKNAKAGGIIGSVWRALNPSQVRNPSTDIRNTLEGNNPKAIQSKRASRGINTSRTQRTTPRNVA